MSRKKTSDDELLRHNLIIRVNDGLHQKLSKLLAESDCQSIAEVARKILTGQKINCFYKDASMNAPMEELALIRKELKAIGVNINQQTRYFNACKSEGEKNYHADQTVMLYTKVELKVERLFELISKLAEKWLLK
ncbi:plasmid mobilization relaxosome protein MobC [Pedobacter sp. LMG 31464]|uniref:Plasmid mobilization relaxosome protein MobC n=1 Tax=Pedobacter planticolens TaxID=2679964 RepID=A0A923IWD2_9SPHI|nr:plasmid mobilization relaxosome protein MobC [Pedobacter planticolens]MBB2146788.1 plasmid mobilization relaxosome protein MobC [Pedobacter planticolens]